MLPERGRQSRVPGENRAGVGDDGVEQLEREHLPAGEGRRGGGGAVAAASAALTEDKEEAPSSRLESARTESLQSARKTK